MKQDLLLSRSKVDELHDYKFIGYGKKRLNVDKSIPVHNYFVNDIPKILQKEIDQYTKDIEIRSSVGEGRISEVFWIMFGQEAFVPRNPHGKLTTQKGIYIVLLFDSELERAYLAIANGSEHLSGTELMELSKKQISIIEKLNHKEFMLNNGFDIRLGKGTRPRKYVQGIPLYKQYQIDQINIIELVNDVMDLKELLETIVTEKGIGEIEDEVTDKKRKVTTINPDKYKQIRRMKEERDEKIGGIAEEYVYKKELEKVNSDCRQKVKLVSKEKDGLGYDIESIFEDGSCKYIEVKGTSLNDDSITYYLSNNELKVAKKLRKRYVLVLVSNVMEGPRIIKEIIDPASSIFKNLEPIQFKGMYP